MDRLRNEVIQRAMQLCARCALRRKRGRERGREREIERDTEQQYRAANTGGQSYVTKQQLQRKMSVVAQQHHNRWRFQRPLSEINGSRELAKQSLHNKSSPHTWGMQNGQISNGRHGIKSARMPTTGVGSYCGTEEIVHWR
eukprot:scpid45095/ scgid27075/ 